MAYSILKLYKHSGLLIACNEDVFKPPKSYFDYDILSIRDYREQIQRAKRIISQTDVHRLNENYLYMYNKRMDKLKHFNVIGFNRVNKRRKEVNYDFSCTSDESVRKARRRFNDIALCNDFDYFVTFTFAPECCDRYLPSDVVDKFSRFCKDYFRRNEGYYLAVPEHHEDGAFHFHCLISSTNRDKSIVRGVDSSNGLPACDEKGRPVYNCLSWKYGNSHLIPVNDDISHWIYYIMKYMTKSARCLPRFYYSGGCLVRKPAIVYFDDVENAFDKLLDVGGLLMTSTDENCPFKFAYSWIDDTSAALYQLDDF